MKKVILIGAGGHGRVVADIVRRSGDEIIGFLDDDLSKPGAIGKIEDYIKYKDAYFVISIGCNKTRRIIAEKYDFRLYTAIHPTAVIGEDVTIGEGTVIMANSVINPSTIIGKHCIINTGAVVEHNCILEDYVHISPNATLCGSVYVGENTHIGAGAVVRNNLSVGRNVKIGIAAAVVKDIEQAGVYAGVPAKELV